MTNGNLSELIAALSPEDERGSSTETGLSQDQLREILADLAHRPVPVRSLHRLWTLGELSAQIALAYLGAVGAPVVCGRGNPQAAGHGNQSARRVEDVSPPRLPARRHDQTRPDRRTTCPTSFPPRLAETLDRLHFEAPPMHFSLIREVISQRVRQGSEEAVRQLRQRGLRRRVARAGTSRAVEDRRGGGGKDPVPGHRAHHRRRLPQSRRTPVSACASARTGSMSKRSSRRSTACSIRRWITSARPSRRDKRAACSSRKTASWSRGSSTITPPAAC